MMYFKLIVIVIFLAAIGFILYRFGFINQFMLDRKQQENLAQPTLITPSSISPPIPTPSGKVSSESAKIVILTAPLEASKSEAFRINWYIDSDKIATTSHTAIHFGKTAQPNAKLPSDYPEKSPIFNGTIPATFSAELKILNAGVYFYRAHIIISDMNIWSDEKTIQINQ